MAANGARGLRKPVFVKVDTLKPGTNGHTMVVKVVSSDMVLQKGAAASPHLRNTRISECLVGDDTASILFTARNDQGIYGLLVYVDFIMYVYNVLFVQANCVEFLHFALGNFRRYSDSGT